MNSFPLEGDRAAAIVEHFGCRLFLVFSYFFFEVEFKKDREFIEAFTKKPGPDIIRGVCVSTIQAACLNTTLMAIRDLDDFFKPRSRETRPDDLKLLFPTASCFCFLRASAKHGTGIRRRSPTLARTVFLAHYFSMLTDEQTSPEQFAIYRRMTPDRRLALAEQLCWTAREMKTAWLRSQHADWPEEKVRREVAQIFSHART